MLQILQHGKIALVFQHFMCPWGTVVGEFWNWFVENLVGRTAFEGKGPQRGPQKRLGRRLEEVAKAVGGGYCRLQMPLKPAFGVRETVAGHRRGALEGGGGGAQRGRLWTA